MPDETTIIQQKAQKNIEELLNLKPEHPDYRDYFKVVGDKR